MLAYNRVAGRQFSSEGANLVGDSGEGGLVRVVSADCDDVSCFVPGEAYIVHEEACRGRSHSVFRKRRGGGQRPSID